MAKGIRPYGPGKFNTLIDSYAYALTGDGVDEEASLGEGNGWYGLIRLDHSARGAIRDAAVENHDDLTNAEMTMLETAAAIIFFERSDGIVESDWFDNLEDANEQWAAIEEDASEYYDEEEPEEEEETEEEPE